MTVTEQKAEMLDELMAKVFDPRDALGNRIQYLPEVCLIETTKCYQKWVEFAKEKTFTEDPYINEVFSRRTLNLIEDSIKATENPSVKIPFKDIRMSDLPPHEGRTKWPRGWGEKSIAEYKEVFDKYRKK